MADSFDIKNFSEGALGRKGANWGEKDEHIKSLLKALRKASIKVYEHLEAVEKTQSRITKLDSGEMTPAHQHEKILLEQHVIQQLQEEYRELLELVKWTTELLEATRQHEQGDNNLMTILEDHYKKFGIPFSGGGATRYL